VIKVQGVTKRFGQILAVDDVSFEIRSGEVFGLLGPNGAGKSTAINMMVGALVPDSGSIVIAGAGDPQLPSARMQIGAAPQALAIYDELTAQENLGFFGRMYGLHGAKLTERIEWSLELAGLRDRRKDVVSKFSGGMKRRLNIVCGLVHDPQIIFLDEPTVGVDPQSRNAIFDQIELLKGLNRTIVYTTHYMEEAQRLCDRVAIVDHGKILDLGTVKDLISRHGGKSVIVAELESQPPVGVTLPGVRDKLHLRFESDRPFVDIYALQGQGVVFSSLHVEPPDLEIVFLNLTGRRLRD
jgi:ABC-2 type transport system ATP-binding protein